MIIKRVLTTLSLLLIGFGLMAATPYATINYAEGSSFMLIRDGKSTKILVDAPEVLGMELKSGDILQTAASTFLEISIKSIAATVQVAENTSFKCVVDSSGVQVTGELYYGRVRAKVTKLAGASTFHISTPSLVAGVRGTNFGCDAIATRPVTPQGAASVPGVTVITNRVFCFEGSVTVDDTSKAVPETILISPNEMVEKTVDQQTVSLPLKKTAINPEINEFWEEHPITSTPLAVVPADAPAVALVPPVESPVNPDFDVIDHKWPEGRSETPGLSKAVLPTLAAVTLIVMGTTTCIISGYYQSTNVGGNVFDNGTFKAGLVLIGTGSVFALVAAFLH